LRSRAIAGSAVDNTVASRFSMNKAQATIKGTKIRKGSAPGLASTKMLILK
jgi:hypothetical protein